MMVPEIDQGLAANREDWTLMIVLPPTGQLSLSLRKGDHKDIVIYEGRTFRLAFSGGFFDWLLDRESMVCGLLFCCGQPGLDEFLEATGAFSRRDSALALALTKQWPCSSSELQLWEDQYFVSADGWVLVTVPLFELSPCRRNRLLEQLNVG